MVVSVLPQRRVVLERLDSALDRTRADDGGVLCDRIEEGYLLGDAEPTADDPPIKQMMLVSDMVLTGRRLSADEALSHGIVSRVVPNDELDATAHEMAEKIAASPAVTVKLARKVIAHLSRPQIRTSMEDELIYQTFLNKSEDFAEFRAARAEEREPNYRGS